MVPHPAAPLRRIQRLAFGAVLSLAASPVAGAHESPQAPRPSILLITVDTLRADSLGWVAGRNETPAIDALAREGFALSTVVSPVPVSYTHLTLPTN